MKKLGRIIRIATISVVLLFIALATVASAMELGGRRGGRGGGHYSVAEPAAVVLLAGGLISLGLYAKRKRGKK